MSRRRLVAGNWKLNGSLADNAALVQALLAGLPDGDCEVLLCPPAVYLAQLQQLLAGQDRVACGAQDVSADASGARTGDVSAAMLREFGVRYCLVGHSERRRHQQESDLLVAAKAGAALAAGLSPIVCLGETEDERERGLAEFMVRRQLAAVLALLGERAAGVVLAYEPVWAIGTGRTATAGQAQAMHGVLRAELRAAGLPAEQMRILYGGSMTPANAAELLAQPDIDGGLVGGASLRAADFLQIAAAAG